jgi:class 3 adenylate cyclase
MKAIHQTFNPYSWVLTLIACLFFVVVSAQESQINTLQKQLQQGNTTAQVDLRNNLANLLSDTKSDEAKKYAEEAEKMARKINYSKGEADALSILGVLMAHNFDRADLAAKYHEKAFGIYKSLKVKGQFSEAQMKVFLTEIALPTYQFVLNEENSGRRTRKAFKTYQDLERVFTQYLNESVEKTQEQLSETESKLTNTNAKLSNTNSALVQKSKTEKKLILDKLKLFGNLEAKEIEAIALADSLTVRELESKTQAIILLEEKAKSEQKQAEVDKHEILNFALMLGIGLGSLLLLVIVWLWWQQYKNNQLLIEQKAALAQKNQEINIQKEEILAQHDNIEQQNAILYQQKEEIEAQRDNLSELHEQVIQQRDESNGLLLNILPAEIAQELKETGHATPKYYDMATVLFTDFKGFTQISEKLTPEQIIHELDYCFLKFDEIIEKYNVEKIKTIGDAYMCAGGIPIPNRTNALDVVKAGLEMKEFMEQFKAEKQAKGEAVWELRIGIHTGPLVAGVIGKNKFAYDIWGDTVNIASRMESSGEVGKVNISETTYELVKSHFQCTHRGKIAAKNKGEIDMYFVDKKTSLFQGIRNLNAQASSVGA